MLPLKSALKSNEINSNPCTYLRTPRRSSWTLVSAISLERVASSESPLRVGVVGKWTNKLQVRAPLKTKLPHPCVVSYVAERRLFRECPPPISPRQRLRSGTAIPSAATTTYFASSLSRRWTAPPPATASFLSHIAIGAQLATAAAAVNILVRIAVIGWSRRVAPVSVHLSAKSGSWSFPST